MNQNLLEAKELLSTVLGIDPVYLVDIADSFKPLSDTERRFIFSPGNDDVIGFTTPVADLMMQQRLRYEWKGRGFCCVFRQSTLNLSRQETFAVSIHEAGHYLADCNRPERDDTDHGRAVKSFWTSGLAGENGGHSDRWIRATIHAWARCVAAGYDIAAGDVMQLDRYGLSSTGAYVESLLPEAASRRSESIEAILATSAPSAFSRLYSVDTGQAVRRSAPASRGMESSTLQPSRPSAKSRRRGTRFLNVCGSMVESLSDGRIRELDNLDGTKGKVFASIQDYFRHLDGKPRKKLRKSKTHSLATRSQTLWN